MTTTPTMPKFGRGAEAAAAADEEQAASRGSSFRRLNYLPNIGEGNSIFIRYVTDAPYWWYIQTHQSVPTKPTKPADWPEKAKWPESMSAICRCDKAFVGFYPKDDCWICKNKPVNKWGREASATLRLWAIAVIREEVIGDQSHVEQGLIPAEMLGKRIGFKDATRKVAVPRKDENGNEMKGADGKLIVDEVIEPAIILVNKAWGNYFEGLNVIAKTIGGGTITNRDFILQQQGEGSDVKFLHIHLDVSPDHQPGTESWKRYEKAIEEQGIDIDALLMDRSSDDFFATFFDPTKTAPPRKNSGSATSAQSTTTSTSADTQASAPAAQQASAPSGDVDPDLLARMRDRVRGVTPEAGAPAQQEAAPAPAGMLNL